MPDKRIKLQGRVFITGEIQALTGLHIGAGGEGVSIGGLDNIVVRDTLTQVPYIPGSSLKGKMRSLSEKLANLPQNQRIGRDVSIHTCESEQEYRTCYVCQIYGLPGERNFSGPTRLIVRDVLLDVQQFPENAKTDFPYTETKWEAAIDRITSAAVPRQMERVPAGAIFKEFEFVYNLYQQEDEDKDADVERLPRVFEAMQLVEDDYIGGLGSRGSGKVQFKQIDIAFRPGDSYGKLSQRIRYPEGELEMSQIIAQQDDIVRWVKEKRDEA
ncbi:MAG: type III-A CRISPR-associated RAMP protein Csm3 [Candidatus Poribacteria bacterium]